MGRVRREEAAALLEECRKNINVYRASYGWNSGIGDLSNKTSHDTIQMAGERRDRFGNVFTTWHSPSVTTVPVYIDGLDTPFHWKNANPRQKRATRKSRIEETESAIGAWDRVDVDGRDKVVPRSKRQYVPRVSQEELNSLYESYRAGQKSTDEIMTKLLAYVTFKAHTSSSERNLRVFDGKENVETIEGYIGGLVAKLWPVIRDVRVDGPLSHYVNHAYRLFFIDAQKETTQEWNFRRQMASQAAASELDVHITEAEQDTPQETMTGYRDHTAAYLPPSAPDVDIVESVPTTKRAVLLSVQQKAFDAVAHRHEDPDVRQVMFWISAEFSNKRIATALGFSEAKVSRLRSKAERAISQAAARINTQEAFPAI
jgi:hypothetical protein